MRKLCRSKPLWGVLAVAAFGPAASAQSPLEGAFPPGAPPGYAAAPNYSPVAGPPPGHAPSMQPWPGISPFESGYDSLYNDRGMWFRDRRNTHRDYYVNAEFLYGRFRSPGGTAVGADVDLSRAITTTTTTTGPNVNAPAQVILGTPLTVNVLKDSRLVSGRGRFYVDSGGGGNNQTFDPSGDFSTTPADTVYEIPRAGIVEGISPDDDGTPFDDDVTSRTPFNPVNGDIFSDGGEFNLGGTPSTTGEKVSRPGAPGARLTFGLMDEDQSGFEISGMGLFGGPQTFQRGYNDPVNLLNSRVTAALLLNDPGTAPDTVQALTFNQYFDLKYQTDFAGTDVQFFQTPLVDLKYLVLKPSFGARYNYIGEQFEFFGSDNGAEITYDALGQPLNGAAGSVQQPGTYVDPDTLVVTPIQPYSTSLNATTRSHLYGPQVGMNYALGGDNLMISGNGKFGLAANTETVRINGYGMGYTEALTGQRVYFDHEKTSTHVSPTAEFTANADMNIFPYVPVLNRSFLLKNAKFRLGYTGFVAFEVTRPLQSINWLSENSGGPQLQTDRTTFYSQFYNFGLHWNF